MKTLAAALCLSFFTFMSLTARADNDISSGNYWFRICQDEATRLACIGFVQGVIRGYEDGVIQTGQRFKIKADDLLPVLMPYCVPAGATNAQVKDVFVKYLADHPEVRHKSAVPLIRDALTEAFKCLPH